MTQVDPPAILARAWSVDATGAERLIAQLVDTTGEGVVSVGDTVEVGEYPKDFVGASYGNFTVAGGTHAVTGVTTVTSIQVIVASASGNHEWFSNTESEQYSEFGPFTPTIFTDNASGRLFPTDVIQTHTGTPGTPESPDFTISQESPTNDPFLNVEINVP